MDLFINLSQIFLAAAMFDVWWLRYHTPGIFRGGDSKTMEEEFRVYGLPDWFRNLVRVLKLGAGGLMLVGLWSAPIAFFAGVGLAILMGGAVSMHIKVRDPLYKTIPSFSFLLLCLLVAYWHRPPFF